MTLPLHSRARSDRGAALLVAIAAVAVVTAVGVDLAYNTRVSLQAAANSRDELRATYLAKSAVNLSRLLLHFQQQIDGTSQAMSSAQPAAMAMLQRLQPGVPAQGAAAALSSAMPSIGVRLWELVPIDSAAASLFLGSMGTTPAAAAAAATAPAPRPPVPPAASAGAPGSRAGAASGGATAGAGQPGAAPDAVGERRLFGDMEGSFRATIEDEDRKINIRQFDGLAALTAAQTLRLAQLIKDPTWDFLFDEDDANGIRVSRRDLFGALKDWEDQDETSSTFTGDPAKPFENGFGDENPVYDRLAERYKAKNAPYDSLDELFLVAGVSDVFMAAFGPRLTVYPDVSGTINVNTDDPQQIMVNALLMSDPPGVPQPALADPAFHQKLAAALALLRPFPFMAISPQQFAGALQALGIKVKAEYLAASNPNNAFSNRSSTFRIRATGTAGDVKKTIEAVVTFDRRAEQLAQDTGRLLHWHEE